MNDAANLRQGLGAPAAQRPDSRVDETRGRLPGRALRFRTRLNDGWGISRAEISPVPLPAAAWMLVAGLGTLVGFRSRARRV